KGEDDRPQVDMSIGDVQREDAAWVPQVPEVDPERLLGQQVERDRAPAEGIEHEDVELLAPPLLQLAFHRQASVAEDHLDACGGRAEVAEVFGLVRQPQDLGVDLVETYVVPRPPVGCDRADAEPDAADAHGGRSTLAPRMVEDRQAEST